MKAKYVSLAMIFAAVVMWISGCAKEGVVDPADAVPAAEVTQAKELKLAIVPEKQEYLVGEPIYLQIQLQNQGRQPIRVLNRLWPGEGGVTITLGLADGHPRTYVPMGYSDFDETAYMDLKPGERIGDIFPVFYGGEGWTFQEAGEYSLQASYVTGDGERGYKSVTSPATNIVLASKQGAGVELVSQGERSSEAGKFLIWTAGDHLSQGRALLDEILEETPESPLASYIYYALGKSMSEPFANYLEDEVRAADCRQALDYFGRIDEEVITDYVRSQIALAKTRCALSQQDWAGAQDAVADFHNITVDRPEYANTRARLAEFETYLNKARE